MKITIFAKKCYFVRTIVNHAEYTNLTGFILSYLQFLHSNDLENIGTKSISFEFEEKCKTCCKSVL